MIQSLNLLVTNARAPTGSCDPAKMIEFLTKSADQISRMLAIRGFDEIVMVMAVCRFLGAGSGHIGLKITLD